MDPSKVNYSTPLDTEVEVAVHHLLPYRAGRHTHLCTEHFKQWQMEVYPGSSPIPPVDGALAVSGRYCTAHVAHGGYTKGVGMECPGPNSNREHRHMGHRPDKETMEGGGVADRHPSTCEPPTARRLKRVQGQKRYRDRYNEFEYISIVFHHRPRPPLSWSSWT